MDGGPTVAIYHRRCSLLAMTGESLKGYKHGIKATTEDVIEGDPTPRTKRISVIFRDAPPPKKHEE